jgi:hypothetical protein
MGGTPGDDSFELDEVVGDGADFHQLGFNGLGIPHDSFRMAHPDGRLFRLSQLEGEGLEGAGLLLRPGDLEPGLLRQPLVVIEVHGLVEFYSPQRRRDAEKAA